MRESVTSRNPDPIRSHPTTPSQQPHHPLHHISPLPNITFHPNCLSSGLDFGTFALGHLHPGSSVLRWSIQNLRICSDLLTDFRHLWSHPTFLGYITPALELPTSPSDPAPHSTPPSSTRHLGSPLKIPFGTFQYLSVSLGLCHIHTILTSIPGSRNSELRLLEPYFPSVTFSLPTPKRLSHLRLGHHLQSDSGTFRVRPQPRHLPDEYAKPMLPTLDLCSGIPFASPSPEPPVLAPTSDFDPTSAYTHCIG
ncbi:uncharacterized protein EI90DRAFT_3118130 [Cantharellus anzutake]|uniref:uncharacterized protein n=1 Tax=Cantharellus anzutake TaxID=1750568 RepID=UPI001903AF01|nr:uncharacterized protein EI90DRAFT_3118130 [Cantharellus anzutake]KAF8339056.1 hypothetical protein EI90DRAFT_3118130 [Cantharellus anzutake]